MSETNKSHPQVSVYSRDIALKVENDKTQSGYHTIQIEVARRLTQQQKRIESPNQEYDWSNKMVSQLMERELPAFIAFLNGWLDAAEWSFRGKANNKSIHLLTTYKPMPAPKHSVAPVDTPIETGEGNKEVATTSGRLASLISALFSNLERRVGEFQNSVVPPKQYRVCWIQFREKGEKYPIRIDAESMFRLATFATRQLMRNHHGLTADAVLGTLKNTVNTETWTNKTPN